MRSFAHQISYAARGLRKSPGFTAAALAILTLGIGANTAIFSVVNAVLLKPLPFGDAQSIVAVWHVPPARAFPGVPIFPASAANYFDWRSQTDVFESMALFGGNSFRLGGGNRPQAVLAVVAEPDFFTVLRVEPAFGRTFTRDECQPGRDRVIVLSHRLAIAQFPSVREAVGRTMELDGAAYQVIGVMPEEFRVPSWFPAGAEAWAPLALTAADRAVRDNHNLRVIARLKDGVSVQQANAQLDTVSQRLARQYPIENTGWGATAVPLRDFLVGDVRAALWTLLGAVAFVLLIACANTANLVLARTIARRKELAIRAALGASASQVVRPVLVETTLLAVGGGALGLLFAEFGQKLVIGALAGQMPRATEVRVDGQVLVFTLVASILTGLAAGLIASWRLTRVDVNESLKQGGRTASDSRGHRTRTVLVVSEVALSLMLLVGAGLMIRTLWELAGVNPGFDPKHVVTMTVPAPVASEKAERWVYDRFLARVRTLPGVSAVGATDTLPLDGGGSQQPIVIEGRPAEVFAMQPNVDVRVVTPGYWEAMGIPIVAGRDFTEQETIATPTRGAIVISQALARQYWPGENPVGKRLRISFTPDVLREVVGVVGDVKERGLDVMNAVPMLYVPYLHDRDNELSLVVRSDREAAILVPAITRVLQEINPELPIRNVRPMEEVVAVSLSQRRFSMALFAALAGLAVMLAAVGIYSVLSYGVRLRGREIGIRMALGARGADVVRLVVMEGMKPALVGVAAGIFGALALSGIVGQLIYGVSATDPWTFAAVAVLLAAIAVLACAIPAYRATRVQPITALRAE